MFKRKDNSKQIKKRLYEKIDQLVDQALKYENVNQIECDLHVAGQAIHNNSVISYRDYRPLTLKITKNGQRKI